MLQRWVQQIRPHQWVHQLTVIVLVSHFGQVSWERLLSAPTVSLFGTLAFLLIGDYKHRNEDAQMGRDRLTHHLSLRAVLGCLGVCLAVVFGFAVYYGGLLCLAFVAMMLGATLLYNIAKKKRRLWLSYTGRFASGVALVGVYHSYFYNELSWQVLPLAMCAGFLDVAGNLAGDIRDLLGDRQAGLSTFPLRWGTHRTVGFILVLQGLGYVLVFPMVVVEVWWWLSLLVWPFFGALLLVQAPTSWKHGAIHGPKLLQLLWIGAALYPTATSTVVASSFVFTILWLGSYRLYHWSARRTTQPILSVQSLYASLSS